MKVFIRLEEYQDEPSVVDGVFLSLEGAKGDYVGWRDVNKDNWYCDLDGCGMHGFSIVRKEVKD